METLENSNPEPTRFWQYAFVFVIGMAMYIYADGLKEDGWGKLPKDIARSIFISSIYAVPKTTWHEKLSTFIKHSLFIMSSLLLIYYFAPFLSNYLHKVAAYALSALPIAFTIIYFRYDLFSDHAADKARLYKLLGWGVSGSILFGLVAWLISLNSHL
jgi:hypothetical protein